MAKLDLVADPVDELVGIAVKEEEAEPVALLAALGVADAVSEGVDKLDSVADSAEVVVDEEDAVLEKL